VRLPRDSTVGDVLSELSTRLGPEYAGRRLRLLEVYHNKIYKVWLACQSGWGSQGRGRAVRGTAGPAECLMCDNQKAVSVGWLSCWVSVHCWHPDIAPFLFFCC
jgi:hypothetical protein